MGTCRGVLRFIANIHGKSWWAWNTHKQDPEVIQDTAVGWCESEE